MSKQINISIIEFNLLKLLINHKQLSLDQIEYFLELKSPTSLKYISNLNKFLKKTNLGNIVKEKKYTLILNTINIDLNFFCEQIYLVPQERLNYLIFILIFEDYITLSSLQVIFDVTQGTLMNDIRKLKIFLKKFKLKILTLPWKGIILTGTTEDINDFSIQFLLKILLEKEFNTISWNLYGIFINPLIKNYLDKKLEIFNYENLELISSKIIQKFNLIPDIYYFTTIKTIIIYSNLKKNILVNNYLKPEFIEANLKIQSCLINIQEFKNNNFYFKSIPLLAKVLVRYEQSFFLTHVQNLFINTLIKRIKKIYDITLNEKELCELTNLILISQFKYDFNIKNFNYYHITKSEIPESILRDIKYIFKELSLKMLKEDIFLLALFIYQIVCEKYIELSKNRSFLLYDSSYNNWIGRGFKNELKKYLPKAQIDVMSIYQNTNSCFYENYNYVIFLNSLNKEFLKLNYSNKRFIFLEYKDHFEINNFWGQLFFGKGGEIKL